MQLPAWIDIGGKKYEYGKCNTYQKALYPKLIGEIEAMRTMQSQNAPQALVSEKMGAIKYIAQVLDSFTGILEIKNYEKEGDIVILPDTGMEFTPSNIPWQPAQPQNPQAPNPNQPPPPPPMPPRGRIDPLAPPPRR